jgi:hypothetical protein
LVILRWFEEDAETGQEGSEEVKRKKRKKKYSWQYALYAFSRPLFSFVFS